MKAYWTLTQATLRSFLRDRQGLFWSFFFPLFFIVIFGSIFGRADNRDRIHIPIGLVSPDRSPRAAWVPDAFRHVPVFEVSVGTLDAETEALRAGKRRVVVVFPERFGDALADGQRSTVRLLVDPMQPQMSQTAAGVVRQVLDGIDRRITGAPSLLDVHEETVMARAGRDAHPRQIDYLIPGILAMTIMQLGLFTAIPIINMREKGILKRYRATPLSRPVIVASQITQRLVISVIQTLTIVLVGMGLYHFRVAGSWLALLALVVFGVLTFVCIGALLSAVAKTQESGISLVQLVNFPMMFLSGLFFPLEFIPNYLKPIVSALPATYLADALRHVTLAAPTAFPIGTSLGVLAVWLFGGLILAARVFRWE